MLTEKAAAFKGPLLTSCIQWKKSTILEAAMQRKKMKLGHIPTADYLRREKKVVDCYVLASANKIRMKTFLWNIDHESVKLEFYVSSSF